MPSGNCLLSPLLWLAGFILCPRGIPRTREVWMGRCTCSEEGSTCLCLLRLTAVYSATSLYNSQDPYNSLLNSGRLFKGFLISDWFSRFWFCIVGKESGVFPGLYWASQLLNYIVLSNMYHTLKQLEVVAFTTVPVQHRTSDINLGLKIHVSVHQLLFIQTSTLINELLCLKLNKDVFQSTKGERLHKGYTQGKIGEITHHCGSKWSTTAS